MGCRDADRRPDRWSWSGVVGAVIGVLLAPLAKAGTATPSCTDGARIMMITSGERARAGVITIDAGAWELDACPTAASVRTRRAGLATVVRAKWTGCGNGAQVVRFSGRMTRQCTAVHGRWRTYVPGRPGPRHAMNVRGRLSRCGDRVVDPLGGEECDGTSCAAPLACSATCRCEDPDVRLDPDFGSAGIVAVGVGSILELARDPQGRLLIATRDEGTSGTGVTGPTVVRRISSEGVIEPGLAAEIEAPSALPFPVTILPLADGGFLSIAATVRRWDSDGRRFVSFGDAGELPRPIAAGVSTAGRLVTFDGQSLSRLLLDGTPDPEFGPVDPPEQLATGVSAATILPDGGAFVVQGANELKLYRILPNGTVDGTYGLSGAAFFALAPFPYGVTRLLQLSDGTALVQGYMELPTLMHGTSSWSKRISADGQGVGDWGSSLGVLAVVSDGVLQAYAAEIDGLPSRNGPLPPPGVPVRPPPQRVVLQRWNDRGILDPGFGRAGVKRVPVYGAPVGVVATLQQPDGGIVIATRDRLVRVLP